MPKIYYIPNLREPVYRKYVIKIYNGSYYIKNYFDTKSEMLKELTLYKKSIATPYILKQNQYERFISKP